MANNQVYHQRADWKKFREDIQRGAKPIVSALHIDDLRQLVILLNFHSAGQYDSSGLKWNENILPLNPTPAQLNSLIPFRYRGMWEIAVFDTSHGMKHVSNQGQSASGRFIRWKINKDILTSQVYCKDTINNTRAWSSSESYLKGFRKFYRPNGNVYEALQNNSNKPPIKADGTLDTENWSLVFAGPPGLYEYDNNGTIEYRSKIHFDTWQKNFSSGYKKDACVSWQNGWKAKRNIELIDIPPHSWTGESWSAGKWPKNKLLLDSDGIRVWKALQDVKNSEDYPNIESTAPENAPDFWEEQTNLAIEWESYGTGWQLQDALQNWQLVPDSGNYLHDYSKNFPGKEIYYDIVVDNGYTIEDLCECETHLFFPKQVDPAEQFEHIIRAYKEQALTNLSGQRDILWCKNNKYKVPFNTLHITDPANLGPCYDVRTRIGWRQQEEYPYQISIVDVDGNGVLGSELDGFNHFKSFPGNQYCNFGGAVKFNSPAGFGNWSENPKITGSLQNHIEVILSDSRFRLPVNSTYRANWRRANFSDVPAEPSIDGIYYSGTYPTGSLVRCTGTDPDTFESVSDDEIPSWDDYPHVNDELWGENEAGIELFLKVHGSYDWYFDMEHRYTPTNMLKNALRDSVDPYIPGNAPSESALWDQWDLIPGGGTLRRGFRYTCGRYNPFMVAGSGSDPTWRKEAWNPNFSSPYGYPMNRYGNYDMACKWFGARTNSIPAINKFDDQFMDITPLLIQGIQWRANQPYKKGLVVHDSGISYYTKQDITNLTDPPASNNQYEKIPIYTFTTPGNRETNATATENVKVGWMLHLCSSTSSQISYDPNDMKSPYILHVKYVESENKTYITVSDTINKGTVDNGDYFTKAGWNRDICIRHDGCSATWSYDETRTITYKIHYQCQPELLLDLKDLLDFAIYKDVSLSREVVGIHSEASYESREYDKSISIALALVNKWISLYNNNFSAGQMLNYWSDGSILINGQYPDDLDAWVLGYITVGGYASPGTSISTVTYFLHADTHYYAFFVRYTWPETLKNAPKTILQKVSVTEIEQSPLATTCPNNEPNVEPYGPFIFPQSCTLGGLTLNNRIVPYQEVGPERLKIYYNYVALSTSGNWYKCMPSNLFPYVKHVGTGGINGPHTVVNGHAHMNMALVSADEKIIMILDWEDVPEGFFTENFFHSDAPRVLQLDDKPPRPNPPVHHYDPFAKLKYILPYDLLTEAQQEDIKEWYYNYIVGKEYQQGDKVFMWINGKRHLFTAKNYIAESTIAPINDPDNWTWAEPWVELHLYGESCLCKDYEASDPVKYRLICAENSNYNTEYTAIRQKDITLKTINLQFEEISSSTSNPSGEIARIPVSNSYDIGDKIEILGTVYYDGVYDVYDAGSGYIDIEKDFYFPETFSSAKIINRTKTYQESDWNNEEFKNYTFAFQAKDSANDCQGVPDNETEVGTYEQITEPDDYIEYFDD